MTKVERREIRMLDLDKLEQLFQQKILFSRLGRVLPVARDSDTEDAAEIILGRVLSERLASAHICYSYLKEKGAVKHAAEPSHDKVHADVAIDHLLLLQAESQHVL